MPSDPHAKVFLSYSSKDKSQARRLAHDLESADVDVWFDEFELKAGDPVMFSIRSAIEEARHLIVLISHNSLTSSWVDKELREAFFKHGTKGSPTIIPVRIDDAPVPEFLRSIKYVDLRQDYENGLNLLLEAFKEGDPAKRVSDVIDPSEFAENLARDRKLLRGPGFFVSTILSFLTIVATIIAAWPAFHQVFGERARVYYTVSQSQMSIPAGLDREKISSMLKAEGVADSNLRISMINRGARDADEIKVGISIAGTLGEFSSKPDAATNPVWVTITPPEIEAGSSGANFTLNDLVPDREVTTDFTYFGNGSTHECDVVADGVLATEVENLAGVPQWSAWQALQTPLLILLGGVFLSIIAGTIAASWANRKFRDLTIEVLNVVFPPLGRLLNSFTK